MTSCLLLIVLGLAFTNSFAADDDGTSVDESATDTKIETSISIVGDLKGYVQLDVAGQKVDATFIDDELGEQRGGVILLHDIGGEIDGSGAITALRNQLPFSGWSTLTVALDYPFETKLYLSESIEEPSDSEVQETEITPPAEDETSAEQSSDESAEGTQDEEPKELDKQELPPVSNSERIQAAVDFLENKGINKLIFLGHGQGGQEALKIINELNIPVVGLILISTDQVDNDTALITRKFAVVDFYGSRDNKRILNAVHKRKVFMKRNNVERYYQREVRGADKLFYGLEDNLVTAVRGWLKTQFVEEPEQ